MVLLCMLAGVLYVGYSMVLLCMLPGVLLYGVAVHVAWSSMLATLWCCCACWLVFHDVYSMVLLCMLAGVLCSLEWGLVGGGGGGGELDTLTQMAGGVALSISSLGLMVSTVTLLHDK